MILAVIGITGEWRHHTITSSLLAAPDRVRFLAAKLIAFAIAGLVLSVLISVAISIVGFVILSARDLPTPELGDLIDRFARNAGIAALGGAFGVGLGAIVRNQVVAIVGLLVLSFAVEPLLIGLAPDVGRFGPFGALPTAAAGIDPQDAGMPEDTTLLAAGVAPSCSCWRGSAPPSRPARRCCASPRPRVSRTAGRGGDVLTSMSDGASCTRSLHPAGARLVRAGVRGADGGAGAGLAGDRHRRAHADLRARPARARRWPRSCGRSTGSSPSRRTEPHAARLRLAAEGALLRRRAQPARAAARHRRRRQGRRSAPATRRRRSGATCCATRRTSSSRRPSRCT